MLRCFVCLSLLAFSQAYLFPCLDGCECDTADEVVHCHNGERTTLALPEDRLRGFHTIGLTYNKIKQLPAEDEMLKRFPDLLAVDVERNPDFDCSSLNQFTTIKVISDCYKNVTDVSQIPALHRPDSSCDLACQAKRHYNDLHKYVIRLWEILRQKYNDFDADTTLQKIKAFLIEAIQKLNRSIDSKLEAYHPRNQKMIVATTEATMETQPDALLE